MSTFNFNDFNIKPVLDHFTGDKLLIDDILNKPIKVIDFKIEDSIKKAGTKRVKMQIELNGKLHIHFSGSTILKQQIEKVPKDKFPFNTTIVKISKHLEFT